MSKNPYDILKERGFFAQVTDEEAVRKLLGTGSVKVYVGYDPTADSLHVGHLYTVMALKHLEDLGHVPVVVLGGGTARVGDPSGKTELRQMITAEAINANSLLARVGSYYHDIGKLEKPEYFSENQDKSLSRHEQLKASMSKSTVCGE